MRPGAGPIVIAGVALIAVVSWLAVQPGAQRPPRRAITSDRPAARPAAPPLARDVLASGVPLSAAQHRALQALATQWEPATATLEHALRAASEEFDHFAKQARAGGRTSLAELHERSTELRELGAELRARRQAHSAGALAVLTDAQRWQLQTIPGGTR